MACLNGPSKSWHDGLRGGRSPFGEQLPHEFPPVLHRFGAHAPVETTRGSSAGGGGPRRLGTALEMSTADSQPHRVSPLQWPLEIWGGGTGKGKMHGIWLIASIRRARPATASGNCGVVELRRGFGGKKGECGTARGSDV